MTYFDSQLMEEDYNRGDRKGRKDAARQWGAQPASNFVSHAEYQGYQDGYSVWANFPKGSE